MDLSDDQREVVDAVSDWAFNPHRSLLTMSGFAGTGKTTCLGHLAARWAAEKKLVAYVAFTGRAAMRLSLSLKRAGVETTSKTLLRGKDLTGRAVDSCYSSSAPEAKLPFCGTLHRMLFRPVIDPETDELRGWVGRNAPDRRYALLVVDEASMIGDELLLKLQEFGVPILAVGDHGQLGPVMASGNLMKSPDLRLEKIHRQAEGNPIISLSRHVREGGLLTTFPGGGSGQVRFTSRSDAAREMGLAFRPSVSDAAVICHTNATRVRLNGIARQALGHVGPPQQGEPVVCLKNKPPVFNGMRGVLTTDSHVDEAAPWVLHSQVEFPEEGLSPMAYDLCGAQFNRARPFEGVDEMRSIGMRVNRMADAGDLYDFGYAMTVHKMQGSGVPHVIVYVDRKEDPSLEDWRRFIYTAVTRAVDRLTIVR